jgi:hypothetical protein
MSLCQFLWPRRRASTELNPDRHFGGYSADINAMANDPPSSDDQKLLAQSWKLFDNEAGRRNSIDTRAAAIMSALGLAATLVTGVGFTVLKDTSVPPAARWIILLFYILSLGYLVRTMLLLFQVHGDVPRYTPDPSDLLTATADLRPTPQALQTTPEGNIGILSAYDRRLACKIMAYTVENYKINNVQQETLFVAQKALRNAILAVVLGGTVAGIMIFWHTLAPVLPPCIIE